MAQFYVVRLGDTQHASFTQFRHGGQGVGGLLGL